MNPVMRTATPIRKRILRYSARAALVVGAIALLPTPASAAPGIATQSSADLKAQAKRLADQLDGLNTKASQLDEQYNDAQIELGQLQENLVATQAEVDAATAALGDGQKLAQKYAIDAYVGGGSVGNELAQPTADDSAGRRSTYLSVLQGNKQQVIADLGAAQQTLTEKQTALNNSKQKVDAKASTIAETKKELTANIAKQQSMLDSTNSQVVTALAAEQQARVQAAAAQAAARLAEQIAADQAARARADQAARARAAQAPAPTATAARAVRKAGVATPVVGPSAPAPAPAGSGSSGGAAVSLPDAPATGAAATAIAAARSQLGVPYRWAAASPGSGFDCSGLVMYAYGQAGRSLPHSSRALYSMTQRLSADQLQPGDLVFGGSPVHHVGLYVGGGLMIHAPHSGDVVRIASIYSTSNPVSFGRL